MQIKRRELADVWLKAKLKFYANQDKIRQIKIEGLIPTNEFVLPQLFSFLDVCMLYLCCLLTSIKCVTDVN